jgi:hypothetical protein
VPQGESKQRTPGSPDALGVAVIAELVGDAQLLGKLALLSCHARSDSMNARGIQRR